jgi:diguanylate cyclase (GGDEF)-like protein
MNTILVADDDEATRASISEMLENDDTMILSAQSGKEAVDLVYHQLPELLVLDMVMPDLTGYEVFRRLAIHPETSRIRVIFITQNLEPHRRMMIRTGRRFIFVRKPIDSEELKEKVRAMLEERTGADDSTGDVEERDILAFPDIEGIYNEAYLVKRADAEMARAEKHGYPLCALKIQFSLPDEARAEGGDFDLQVIKEISAFLKKSKKTIDIAGFCGNLTFLFIIPRSCESHALVFAQKLKNSFHAQSFHRKIDSGAVDVTMGLHHFDAEKDRGDGRFLKAADEALAQARQSGGNQVIVG